MQEEGLRMLHGVGLGGREWGAEGHAWHPRSSGPRSGVRLGAHSGLK